MDNPDEYWIKKAESFKQNRKFEDAIKAYDKVSEIKKNEKEDNFWFKKAINFCDIGEYEQAIDSLFKDLELNQKNYETLFLLGKIYFELERYEEALEYFNKSFEVYGSDHLRNVQKIDKMKQVRKFEEVVKYSDKILQEKPINFDFWYHKGMVLFNLKKFQDASSCFRTCLEKNQENPKILYELAKTELWCKNKPESYEILEKACKLDSSIKEKLRIDKDFEHISKEQKFRTIIGLLNSDFSGK